MTTMFPLQYPLTEAQIHQAAEVVTPHVLCTPLTPNDELSELAGRPVYLKFENLQVTGSFKVRGALARLSRLEGVTAHKGVVAASAGNHALGVLFASRVFGIPALVVVPRTVSPAKLAALSNTVVKVRQHGTCYDEAEVHAREVAEEADATFVSPFDDPWVMAGNGGTLALEIKRQLPEVGLVLAPVGGGGLAAGLGVGLEGVPVLGVNSEASPAMARTLERGEVLTTYDAAPTIADGLEGGVTAGSAALCQRHLAGIAVVSEAALRRAVTFAARRLSTVLEGSAAAGLAALMEGKPLPGRGPVCVVLTGGNISRALLSEIIKENK